MLFGLKKQKIGSNFDDYCNIDVEGKEQYKFQKLGELPIHQKLGHLGLVFLMLAIDAVSLYPSARWDD